jgi:hypothetical protein
MGTSRLSPYSDFTHDRVLSVIAFHEKAGWSQVNCGFFSETRFSPAE